MPVFMSAKIFEEVQMKFETKLNQIKLHFFLVKVEVLLVIIRIVITCSRGV